MSVKACPVAARGTTDAGGRVTRAATCGRGRLGAAQSARIGVHKHGASRGDGVAGVEESIPFCWYRTGAVAAFRTRHTDGIDHSIVGGHRPDKQQQSASMDKQKAEPRRHTAADAAMVAAHAAGIGARRSPRPMRTPADLIHTSDARSRHAATQTCALPTPAPLRCGWSRAWTRRRASDPSWGCTRQCAPARPTVTRWGAWGAHSMGLEHRGTPRH